MRITFLFLTVATIIWGCSTESAAPASQLYVFVRPANFPEADYTFQNNPVTKEGFELGRALFYDPVLSADSSVACANCHQQARSFSDPVHRLSVGVNETIGVRNAPAIQNMAFQQHFFWDGGVKHLDFVPINAITSKIEMAETLSRVVSKLKRNSFYQRKFKSAFDSDEIDSQKMLYALSQFMNLMISANSRYDKYVRNEGEVLSADETQGLKLFAAKCSTCHATDLFTDGSFRNNGLNAAFELDSGRQRVSEDVADRGKFKVPSLRNIELTHPYMHDGRFKTLEEVLNHYSQSVIDSETLDPVLKQAGSLGITMTEEEKAKIILFLKTLTDKDFVKDERFKNPFLK
jgi:cytochrome c peroxidase